MFGLVRVQLRDHEDAQPVKPCRRWNGYASALQPVCTLHPRVHQNMRRVHHYERVHKGASQTCHTKEILFTKILC